MKKIKKLYEQKSVAMTILLILLVILSSFFLTVQINGIEEERCFERLYEEADKLAENIETNIENDTWQLKILAETIGEYEDFSSPELWEYLDSYAMWGMVSRLEILLPDNTVLTKGGKRSREGDLSFDKEASQGTHITDRESDPDGEGFIIRNYVPVIKEGKTAAMLCGVVELGELPQQLLLEPYSGQAAIYIIDGATGEFLVDTWHKDVGNIWELGERKMAPGYEHQQLRQSLTDGERGYVVFVSETTDSYLYFYFEPLYINQWRLALSVPENVVFENSKKISGMLNYFIVFEVICFVFYFIWMLRQERQKMSEKQRQLDGLNIIYDVEQLLFNAHEKQENMDKALENICYLTSARGVYFWILNPEENSCCFSWNKDKNKKPSIDEETARVLKHYFETGMEYLEVYSKQEFQERLPEGNWKAITNFIAVPVEEMDGSICGVLIACDLSEKYINFVLLKSISVSFGMFCHNRRTYNIVKEQGEMDILSGLHNRNRYEMDLPGLKNHYQNSIFCVYIDVNGLHEMNNNNGHEAGDRMLKTVAAQIREIFQSSYTYRIGGDEFLIFLMDTEEKKEQDCINQFKKNLERENIFASVGSQRGTKEMALSEIIKCAEIKMYEEKKRYYEHQEHDRRGRGFIGLSITENQEEENGNQKSC